jgi:WS/DGAT/MGAT family acyltransferase
MERMTGLDASFLYMETDAVLMHTVNIFVVDVADMHGGYSFARVRELLERRIHQVPRMRQRVVEVPGGLHHPVWIEDPAFDLGRHLDRIVLGPAGGERAFELVVEELLGTPLPRDRPLWSIVVVENLPDGRVALVCKVHHAMSDGLAISTVLQLFMTDAPVDEIAPAAIVRRPEPVPGPGELVAAALRERVRALSQLPRVAWQTATAAARLIKRKRRRALELSLPFTGPQTSFNGRLTARRDFEVIDLSLPAMLAVKSAFGCSLNEVVLAVVAGGLRRYLDRHGERHAGPLLASVPVSTGGEGEELRLAGNKVSNLLVSLRTDIDDPGLRLREICRSSAAAKQAHDQEIGELLETWAEYAHPSLVRMFLAGVPRVMPRPMVNLVVSNIRGPARRRHLAGAELQRVYLAGPLLEHVGLNLTVWSYCETMHLAGVACPDAIADLRALLDDCLAALTELAAAARGAAATVSP